MEWLVEIGGVLHFTPFVVPAPDASCAPRRDGGSLESHGLMRAFEKLLRYAPLGLPVVTGILILPKAETIRFAGVGSSCGWQPLSHHQGLKLCT